MEQEIEAQLHKVLNKISFAEKTRNHALGRQTSRLLKILLYMRAAVSRPKTPVLIEES